VQMVKKADLNGDKSWASEGLLIAARLTQGIREGCKRRRWRDRPIVTHSSSTTNILVLMKGVRTWLGTRMESPVAVSDGFRPRASKRALFLANVVPKMAFRMDTVR